VSEALKAQHEAKLALDAASNEAATTAKAVETAKAAVTAAGNDAAKKAEAEKAVPEAEKAAQAAAEKKTAAEKTLADATAKAEEVFKQIGTPLPAYKSTLWTVAYSPDGKLLATGSHDDSLRLWDVEGKKFLFVQP
jgi:hypothetical protein